MKIRIEFNKLEVKAFANFAYAINGKSLDMVNETTTDKLGKYTNECVDGTLIHTSEFNPLFVVDAFKKLSEIIYIIRPVAKRVKEMCMEFKNEWMGEE
ncbi:MAG: hypothetical protein M0P49_07630 [Bacilli bacterium]|nr:hypothetical protein [Bacilli bacterium]